MKFLHTADWHIGKMINGQSMLDDQAYILDQLIQIAVDQEVDAVLMAGDLYDRSHPPKEAVALVNRVLDRFINELAIPVFIIAGNHDGNVYIEYLSGISKAQQLYMEGTVKTETRKISLGEADIYMIPFTDHVRVRYELGIQDIKTIEDAVIIQIERIVASDTYDASRINVLMMHGYVINGSRETLIESESERPLQIGTVESVDVSVMADFDYVALGHLHKAQKVGSERVRYSGSPLKYSKSEVNYEKKCCIVELTTSTCNVEEVTLAPKRDMQVITGTFDELMKGASDDYLYIALTNESYINDAMNRLKYKYPNALALEYKQLVSANDSFVYPPSQHIKSLSIETSFEQFFNQFHHTPLNDAQRKIIRETVEILERQEDK